MNKDSIITIIDANSSLVNSYNMGYIQAISLAAGLLVGILPQILAEVQNLVAEIPTEEVVNEAFNNASAYQIDSILSRFHNLQLGQGLEFLDRLLTNNLHLALPWLGSSQLLELSRVLNSVIPILDNLYVNMDVLNEVAQDRLQTLHLGNSHNSYIYEYIINNFQEFRVTFGNIVECARIYQHGLILRDLGALITPFPLTSMEVELHSSVQRVFDHLPESLFTRQGFQNSEHFQRLGLLCFYNTLAYVINVFSSFIR